MSRQIARGALAVALVGALGLGLIGCLAPAPKKMDKVTVRFSFIVAGHHAPLYLGLEKGFFAEEGIEPEMTEGQGSATTVKLIGAGQGDVGYADLTTMAKAIGEGVPVKAIYAVMQRNPLALAFKADSGIKEPKDLKGKRFGMASGGAETVLVPAFLATAGLDAKDVTFVNIQGGRASDLLLQGQVDVGFGWLTDAAITYRAEKEGHKLNYFLFPDYGVDMVNHGFLASTAMIAEKPDVLKRVVKAISRSWDYAKDHQEEAIQATLKHFPDKEAAMMRVDLANTVNTLHTKNSQGKPLGWMAPEDWESTLSLLAKYGGMPKTQPNEAYYTNEFIPS